MKKKLNYQQQQQQQRYILIFPFTYNYTRNSYIYKKKTEIFIKNLKRDDVRDCKQRSLHSGTLLYHVNY